MQKKFERGTVDMQKAHERNSALNKRNAIIEFYQGTVDPRDIPRRFGVSRQVVTHAASQLPPGLVLNAQSRTLERAANAAAGLTEARGSYSREEAEAALCARIMGQMTPDQVRTRYRSLLIFSTLTTRIDDERAALKVPP